MSIINGIKSKIIIWLFGSKKKHKNINLKNIKSILLNPKDSIGDTLMCFCYARQLRKMYPDAKLGIVVTERNIEFAKLNNENEKKMGYTARLFKQRKYKKNDMEKNTKSKNYYDFW